METRATGSSPEGLVPTEPRANGPCREPQPLLSTTWMETWTRSYWGEEETIEIASDDDTPRATAARASSPTTTADGGVDGRAERGAARTSRTSTTAAAAWKSQQKT